MSVAFGPSFAYRPLLIDTPDRAFPAGPDYVLGVLPGEGIGPDIIACALRVLDAVEAVSPCRFTIRTGGAIGKLAERECGTALSPGVIHFCRDVFAARGAVLAGAGGGRFVYDLRRAFDLYCKLSPLITHPVLADAGRLKPAHVRDVDLLVVRDNVEGLYQGTWTDETGATGRVAQQSMQYTETRVRALLDVAARLASRRRGRLAVVIKDAGLPTVSALWRDCAHAAAAVYGVDVSCLDVDYAAYWMIMQARDIDVVATSNLFGDILGDLGAVLIGSRGLTYSGNFARDGAAVYQTNHGAAYDLAGTDRANPAGQILSLAMLLRESFGLFREARLITDALTSVWRQGWRTEDLAGDGGTVIRTREMSRRVAEEVARLGTQETPDETAAATYRSSG